MKTIRVRRYWGFVGRSFILGGAFTGIWPSVAFFFGMRADAVNALLFVGIAAIVFGCVNVLIDRHYEKKLAHFKQSGKKVIPSESMAIAELPYRMHIFDFSGDGTYIAFRVQCTLLTRSGKEIVVNTRKLIACKGWRIIPQAANVPHEAIVYLNPKNPRDYVIEITITN